MAPRLLTGISGSRSAYVAAKRINEERGQWLIIVADGAKAREMAQDLSFFSGVKIHALEGEDIGLPDYEAKDRDSLYSRIAALLSLTSGEDCVVIAPASTVLKNLPPVWAFQKSIFELEVGQEVPRGEFLTDLVNAGYEAVPKVFAPGQFSARGSIIDIFVVGMEKPSRLDFFDEELETIKSFEIQSQRSTDNLDSLKITPASLVIGDDEVFASASEKLAKRYDGEVSDKICLDIANRENLQKLEYFMPYFYPDAVNMLGYFEDAKIIVDEPTRVERSFEEIFSRWDVSFDEKVKKGELRKADNVLTPFVDDLRELYNMDNVYHFMPAVERIKGVSKFEATKHIRSMYMSRFQARMDAFKEELISLNKKGYDIKLVISGDRRAQNLNGYLLKEDVREIVSIERGYLSKGMLFIDEKFCYITEEEIFGNRRRMSRRVEFGDVRKKDLSPITSFLDIEKGDYIVHAIYGIGRYVGMIQQERDGVVRDFFELEYAKGDRLYVPVEAIDSIQKYIGGKSGNVRLYTLDGRRWEKVKERVRESVTEMLRELLTVSAKRMITPGFAFSEDGPWQSEFEEAFPYDETYDQLKASKEIKEDMQKPVAMDRLLCGDVGYGKTEVAARAMFKAVMDGKQVAVLVPTTILASQHHRALTERFKDFPVEVEMLSRFRTSKEQKDIIERLAKGQVEIIIGTHRLLSKDVVFKDLGLLIVDEEQRFGVAHKERIKALKENVDVLTLSATPIPRTLHMSLIGMRNMSVIEEPPKDRLPVQTFVTEEDEKVVAEAIRREMDRQGQVFVVHNRIKSLPRITMMIETMVPEARVAVAHGQMNEKVLEDIMQDFIDGNIDVLVSTTIIESGIDIPNVNTEIIFDADQFGLSQLYQLRGRVGRSDRLAYAYLLHRPYKALSDVAYERLQAIKEFTELGAGFKLAMRDLEIRGAGNLLGAEQSGHMVEVGYEMYCKLVEQVAAELKGEKKHNILYEVDISLPITAHIPSDFIADESERIDLYRRLADIESFAERDALIEEIEDRFGAPPQEVRNIARVNCIKHRARIVGISSIVMRGDKFEFSFRDKRRKNIIFPHREKMTILDDLENFMFKRLKPVD